MNCLQAFKDFNPKMGECPQLFNYQFNLIAEKARYLLKDRSIFEIQNELKTIDRIINTSTLDSFHSWIKETGGEEMMVFDTPVTHLKYYMNNDAPDLSISIDEALWPEYFAILALAFIGNAKSVEKIKYPYLGFTEEYIENSSRDMIIEYLSDAEEAVDFADSIIKFENIKDKIKNETKEKTIREINRKQSENNRGAANTRFLSNTKIKSSFIAYWQDGNFKSKNEAARQYYEDLSDEEKRILCPTLILDNAVRTLVTHLRRYERQNS